MGNSPAQRAGVFCLLLALTSCAHTGIQGSGGSEQFFSLDVVRPLDLDRRVKSFEVHHGVLEGIIENHPDIFGSTYGWIYYDEQRTQFSQVKAIAVSLRNPTARDIITAVTVASGSYTWVTDGKVVDFVPTVPHPRLDIVARLEKKIPVFEVRDEDYFSVVNRLVAETRRLGFSGFSTTTPEQVRRSLEGTGQYYVRRRIKFLSLKNKSIRECLNAIALAVGPSWWQAIPGYDDIFIDVEPMIGDKLEYYPMPPGTAERHETLLKRESELYHKQQTVGLTPAEEKEYQDGRNERAKLERLYPQLRNQ